MTVRYHQNTTKQNISLFTLALFIEQNIFPEITFITFTLSIHQMILFEEYDVYGTYTVQKMNRITSAVSLRRFVKATSCNVIKKKEMLRKLQNAFHCHLYVMGRTIQMNVSLLDFDIGKMCFRFGSIQLNLMSIILVAVRIHFSHSTCHDMPFICIYTFIYNTL